MTFSRTHRIRSIAQWFGTLPIALFFVLDQMWIFRALVGGIWIKSSGIWAEAFVSHYAMSDGTRYFVQQNPNGSKTSFHETNKSIQQIQEFV